MTLTKQQLISVLVELPGKLQAAEEEVARCLHEKAKLARRMEIRRAQLAISIVLEKGENGKSKYTNEETRKHALELTLADDEHYNQLTEEWEKISVISEQAECELRYQKYRLKVAELLVQLLTGDEKSDEDSTLQKNRGELRDSDRSQDRQAHWAKGRRPGIG